jgi:hypothetical protein
MERKKSKLKNGDILAIPLEDKSYAIAQVISFMVADVAYCAFFSDKISEIDNDLSNLNIDNVISCIAVHREQIEHSVWKVIGNCPPVCGISYFDNEKFKNKDYVDAKIYDASIAEKFLNDYHTLLAGEDWYELQCSDVL